MMWAPATWHRAVRLTVGAIESIGSFFLRLADPRETNVEEWRSAGNGGVDEGRGDGAGGGFGAGVVVHPGADTGAVIEHDELFGEGLRVFGPGLFGEVEEQLVDPGAVVVGLLVDRAGRGLGVGAQEGAAPEIGVGEGQPLHLE